MKKFLSVFLAALLVTTSPAALAASFEIEALVKPTYEEVSSFSDGWAAVKQNGKWGYINESGDMVIQPKYDWAGPFGEGVAVVGLLATETYGAGTDYESTADYYELYLLSENGSAKQLMSDPFGEGATPMQYYVDGIEGGSIESDGYEWFCQNGVINVNGTPFDANGNEIKVNGTLDDQYIEFYTMTGPCVGGVIPMYGDSAVEGGGQAFFMDKNGKITRKFPRYSESNITVVYAPEQDRIVAAKGRYDEEGNWIGGWGAMDMNGNWAVQPVYDGFRYMMRGQFFCDGLMVVNDASGKYGAIDRNGKVVIPLQYEFMSSFSEGMCAVKQNGTFYYIDVTGKKYSIGALSGGAASRVDAASLMSGGISPVYIAANGQAYCVQNVPKNGVLPAVTGTENLAREVYFPEYDAGSDNLGRLTTLGDIIAVKENGKWGFSKLTFHLDLPDENAMDSWAYDEVCKAIEAGLVPNELQNQYRSNITRGDFALLLTEVACTITEKDIETLVRDTTGKELDALVKALPFTDTNSAAVVAANALGILNGYGDGKFGPYDTISRQDAATMLLRAATAIKADALEGWGDKIAAANVQFADGAAFSAYAKEAIQVMAALDVMKGTGNNQFSPKETYTRQQSFMTVYRLMTQILDQAA
ncbi:WG repeat-containing protein [Butyricicoccus faecihominis]|uniref:WG repeat-containing protein n=1 Tax=Butyricicoccus faecihominis TaxID=1712515 RepID=UPI0024787FD5|nr:WG repeat-containing protein [Butyricicoccus faecihominis]MCQ5129692.1 WG repeat-containing protein [Butyricicoccus faecihominis]